MVTLLTSAVTNVPFIEDIVFPEKVAAESRRVDVNETSLMLVAAIVNADCSVAAIKISSMSVVMSLIVDPVIVKVERIKPKKGSSTSMFPLS